jgi:hypothetical protein
LEWNFSENSLSSQTPIRVRLFLPTLLASGPHCNSAKLVNSSTIIFLMSFIILRG